MNDIRRFKYKQSHRHQRMSAVTNIETPPHTSANGNGHKHLPDKLPPSMRVKETFRRWGVRWETLTVAGRTIEKGWVLPQPLGIALLLLIITSVGAMYWRMDSKIESHNTAKSKLEQDNHDLLIRLDQRLIDKEKHDAEKKEELEKRLQNIDATQIVLARDIIKATTAR